MSKYEKPLSIPHLDTKEFWEGCKRHKLLVQQCKECGTYRFPPRPMCHACTSTNMEWIKVSGKGIVHSWVMVRDSAYRPVHPGFAKDRPYPILLIELPDAGGVHMISNIVDCSPENIKIDMPVEVVFDDVTDEITLPKFRPVR